MQETVQCGLGGSVVGPDNTSSACKKFIYIPRAIEETDQRIYIPAARLVGTSLKIQISKLVEFAPRIKDDPSILIGDHVGEA